MGRIACVENIYDTLAAAGLRTDHDAFEDLIWGCMRAAIDPVGMGRHVPALIAELDGDRTEEQVVFDLVDFRKQCGCKEHLEHVIEKAIEMGRWGWENGHILKCRDTL